MAAGRPPCDGDMVHVLFTRRAASLRSHGGEVAFPGGKRDEEDVALAATMRAGLEETLEDEEQAVDAITALREAEEEVGLGRPAGGASATMLPFDPSAVHLLSVLPHYVSRHGLNVRPVVAELRSPFLPIPSADEVAHVFSVPLHLFLLDDQHEASDILWSGHVVRLHYFRHGGEVVWGMTASIAIAIARLVFNREPSFPLAPAEDDVKRVRRKHNL